MTDIIMPRLSDSMEEGTIIKWLKRDGEEVKRGEALAEIETDKATMTYEADAAGFIQIVAGEGDTLAIGAVIGRLLASAERGGRANPRTKRPPRQRGRGTRRRRPRRSPPRSRRAAERRRAAGTGEPPPSPAAATQAAGAPSQHPLEADAAPASIANGVEPQGRPKVSPVARRIARELGVDLAGDSPAAGPTGGSLRPTCSPRQSRSAHRAERTRARPAARSTPARREAALGAKGAVEVIEPNRTQQLIARRMASAKATIPEFQVTVEVDAEAAFELREQLRGQAEPLPSLNDLVIKACGLALRAHPRVNGAYIDGHFERYSRVNIGMAVASEGSLVVPTVFDADTKSLTEIAAADARPRRQGARRHGHAAGARGRHVHRLEPRHVRRRALQRGDQPAAGGDPRGRRSEPACRGRLRRSDRRQARDGADDLG